MPPVESRAAVVFSCLGHLYVHLFTAFYFVIVLALEAEWNLPYPDLIALWTLGSLMVGAAALPAGLLADRFGANPLMVVFFVGMGGCSVAAGFSGSPAGLAAALGGVGLFAAIYHPVGVPWLVRNAGPARGKVLGFNGIFGSLGTALAGLTAGFLIEAAGWRAAFVVPGVVSVATGVALAVWAARGRLADGDGGPDLGTPPSRADMRKTFMVLLVTMFLAGIVYHTTQTALPKVFAERNQGLLAGGAAGVGMMVAGVYAVAGVMQVVGGHLADRLPLKPVYLGAILVQVPLLWLAASLGGVALLGVSTLMVMSAVGALPAENMLLARYTPRRRHGLVFGLKFVLSFGAGPIAVQLVALVTGRTGGFYWVFALLSVVAACAFCAAMALPRERQLAPAAAGA